MRLPLLLVLACWFSTAQTPDPADDPLAKAYQATRSGNDSEAIEWLRQAARQQPERALLWKELGYAYLRSGDEVQSLEMFEKALQLDPDDHHTALELAFAHQRAGNPAKAAALFQQVKKEAPPPLQQTAQEALAHSEKNTDSAPPDPAARPLAAAYEALRQRDYETAIHHFQSAVQEAPERASIRKELGYAYLKIGESTWARDMFEQAARLDPSDHGAALELAFLCHETGQPTRALQLFERLQRTGDPQGRSVAKGAHERISREIERSIERWKEAVRQDPLNRSAQLELAGLYEKYGAPSKAAEHYVAAWFVPAEQPNEEILLKLATAREAAGDHEGAVGAWLLASRAEETRIAEQARGKLPDRYPYASEFRRALDLAPENTGLRRDLAYLLLEVGYVEQARQQFEILSRNNPDDLVAAAQLAFLYLERNNAAEAVQLLERARRSADEDLARWASEALSRMRQEQAQPHRSLGERSLQKSYLQDAQREFLRAYEINPEDYTAALKLGVVHNLLGRDREALRWFHIASKSPDPAVAEQGQRSFDNLAPQFRRFSTSFWTLPHYSSRYQNVFQYSQLKTEMRLGSFLPRPYLSLRFVGDLRQRTTGPSPQFLSESSLVAGFGLRLPMRHGLTLWSEAGEAFNYLKQRPEGVPRAGPDYRGGINWTRRRGLGLGGNRSGAFLEANLDAVYLSRFDNNWLAYWQFRPGYRLPTRGALRSQVYWNFNVTVDRNRAYWANLAEFGPGFRFRVPGVSPPMNFFVDFLRGVHLVNDFNPRRPNYFDIRAGLWYSFAM